MAIIGTLTLTMNDKYKTFNYTSGSHAPSDILVIDYQFWNKGHYMKK